jgi:DNA-binding CsgD family transcriptional regulator
LEPPLEHFLEKFPFASAPIIAMHFNISHSTVKNILSQELGLRKFSRRLVLHQLSDPQKKFRASISVELLALLNQYSELQFEETATGDES